VAGLEAPCQALNNGQVDLLLLDASAELDDDQRNELIRLAATSGADVEVVEAHPGLARLGGVGPCSPTGLQRETEDTTPLAQVAGLVLLNPIGERTSQRSVNARS
jgi:hypothetical protein